MSQWEDEEDQLEEEEKLANETTIANGIEMFGNRLCQSLFFPFFFIFILFASLNWVYEKLSIKPCTESRIVKAVGGCSWWGTCGVTFTDGTIGQASLPTYGQEVCTKRTYFAGEEDRIRIPATIFSEN